MPEVIEADIVQRGGGSETGDVPAQFGGLLIGAQYHGRCIPAHVGADAVFEFVIAGRTFLLAGWNRVDVGGICAVGKVSAGAPRFLDQLLEDEMRSFRPFVLQYAVERVQPLVCFLRIVIRKCRHGLP
jgi:hypothetical protein